MRRLIICLMLLCSGVAWGGMEFDGANDYVDLGNHVLTEGAVEGWFMPTRLGHTQIQSIWSQETSGVVLGDAHWWIPYTGGDANKLRFSIDNGSGGQLVYSDAVLVEDRMYHAVTTFGADGMKMYIDGVLQADTDSWTGGIVNASSSLLGLNLVGSTYWFKGEIYRFKFHSKQLTAPEVAELYNSYGNAWASDGTNTIPPTADWVGAIGYSDGETIVQVKDYSGNGNFGLNYGADFSQAGSSWEAYFNGTSDFIGMGSAFSDASNDTNGTIAFWVKMPDLTVNGNSWLSMTDRDAAINFFTLKMRDPGADAGMWELLIRQANVDQLHLQVSGTLTTSTWHHVALTMSPSGSSAYVDGVKQTPNYIVGSASTVKWFNNVSNSDNLTMGKILLSGSSFYGFEGYLRGFYIYDSALSSNEVYNLSRGVEPATNPTVNYRFTPDDRIYDISGNGLHGTATNGVKQATAQVPTDDAVIDYSGNGNDGVNSGTVTYGLTGSEWYTLYDGVNSHFSIPDASNLSFGNGSTDSPFSLAVKCNTATWTSGGDSVGLIFKGDPADLFDAEYYIDVEGTARLGFRCGDSSTSGAIGRFCPINGMTAYNGQDVWIIATYSGNGANSGCKIYINAVRADDADNGFGSYTAMEDTANLLYIGESKAASQAFNGRIYEEHIYVGELTAEQVTNLVVNGVSPTNATTASYIMRPYTTPLPITKPRTRR